VYALGSLNSWPRVAWSVIAPTSNAITGCNVTSLSPRVQFAGEEASVWASFDAGFARTETLSSVPLLRRNLHPVIRARRSASPTRQARKKLAQRNRKWRLRCRHMNSVSYALHLWEDVTYTSSRNDFKEKDRRSRADDLEIFFKHSWSRGMKRPSYSAWVSSSSINNMTHAISIAIRSHSCYGAPEFANHSQLTCLEAF